MKEKGNNHRKTWSALIILLYSCATIHSSISWEFLVLAFHNYGTSPDLLNALIHPDLKLKIVGLIANLLSIVLADAIMVWRCWIIWGRSWIVVVLPILATVSGTVCAGLGVAGQIAVAFAQDSTSATRLAPLVRFSTPFLSMSLVVTLYTTVVIAWRIIRVQQYAKKHGIKRVNFDYSPVLEIVIESSALYATSLFVFVVLLAMKNPNQNYLQNIHAQIAGIAPTIMIFRIAVGHARKNEDWTSPGSDLDLGSSVETSRPRGPDHLTGMDGVEGGGGGGSTLGTSSNSQDKLQKSKTDLVENLQSV
ncbi:hypothetical protein DFH07DRAFT_752699 [Mycena maculata]|uniref:Uncharacterized protein n=1 Tax=Mycena maculata TaxID=230809 RepID=A0AAD7MYQ2_9AGAR|nr:hypothetical protein DFH07DRAFT_752699 [Mycena maculata]